MKIVTCGIDLAKHVFQLYAISEDGEVIKRQLKRKEVLAFFARLSPCLIGMEACGGAHYWGRELTRLGHTVRLISPQFVKPYVKGNKTDANDAEGIHEALLRPSMRFVGIKTPHQQDVLLLHRVRSGYVKSRTALANQIRGLLTEYGIVIPQRIEKLRGQLVDVIAEDERLSEVVKAQLHHLYEELLHLDDRVTALDKAIMQVLKACPDCQRLSRIPGIGPITATALVASIGDVSVFRSGRELSAWLGIVPKQHSSGGKSSLLGISKRGDRYLRTLLIHGARSVLKYAKRKSDSNSVWLKRVEARRGYNKACVAQANKTARIVWSLLVHKTDYRVAA